MKRLALISVSLIVLTNLLYPQDIINETGKDGKFIVRDSEQQEALIIDDGNVQVTGALKVATMLKGTTTDEMVVWDSDDKSLKTVPRVYSRVSPLSEPLETKSWHSIGRTGVDEDGNEIAMNVNAPMATWNQFDTDYGYIKLGPANTTGSAHIYTDQTKFMFDKAIYTKSGEFGGYGDLKFMTGTVERMRYVKATGFFGVGTTDPKAKLHVSGNDGLLVQGTYGSGTTQNLGTGTRMHFYPKKAAFRVGYTDGVYWNDANIGKYSIAMGSNTVALGDYSTAIGQNSRSNGYASTAIGHYTESEGIYSVSMGYKTFAKGVTSVAFGSGTTASGQGSTTIGDRTTASGLNSTAMGHETTASGECSTASGFFTLASGNHSTAMGANTKANGFISNAMGNNTTASGDYSISMGDNTIASGDYSTSMGILTTASSMASVAIGRYNVGGGNLHGWVGTDPIFEVGIGGSAEFKMNALTVIKNGNVGIGTHAPEFPLHITRSINPWGSTFAHHIKLEVPGGWWTMGVDDQDGDADFLFRSKEDTDGFTAYIDPESGNMAITSDGRYKKNIEPVSNVLEKIELLEPVSYHRLKQDDSEQKEFGFIAQDVNNIFPDNKVAKIKNEYWSLFYDNFGTIAIAGVKELKEKHDQEIDELKTTIVQLLVRIENLENN